MVASTFRGMRGRAHRVQDVVCHHTVGYAAIERGGHYLLWLGAAGDRARHDRSAMVKGCVGLGSSGMGVCLYDVIAAGGEPLRQPRKRSLRKNASNSSQML